MNETAEERGVALRDNTPPMPLVVNDTPTALLPARSDLEAMMMIANEAIKATGAIPKSITTKEQAVAVMLAGWELGLRPMTALRHVYVVNGKTEIETRAMVGIIKARRPDIDFSWPEYTREAVTCIIDRAGQPQVQVRYTVDDAKASGQYKPGPWQQYTRDMLYAAATKRACRLACPDLINAIETGLEHTVAEAESYSRDIRAEVISRMPAREIPADAYNAGDAPGEPLSHEAAATSEANTPPAAPADDMADHMALANEARVALAELKEAKGPAVLKALQDAIAERFPNVLQIGGDGKRRFAVGFLDVSGLRDLLAAIVTLMSDGEPEAPAVSDEDPAYDA